LAKQALDTYKQAEENKPAFWKICQEFLALAGARRDVPGLAIIHILMYFSHRITNPTKACKHLLGALSLQSTSEPCPLMGPILNDLAVLYLLFLNAPRVAIKFFEASAINACGITDAGLENLRLIHQIARLHSIDVPDLNQALRKAEEGIRLSADSPRRDFCHRPLRPDPTCDNWAWYLAEKDVKPAMLCCNSKHADRNSQAVKLIVEALKKPSGPRRASMLAAATKIMSVLEPLATCELDIIEAMRQAKHEEQHCEKFTTAISSAEGAMGRGEFDAAFEQLCHACAIAATSTEKRSVESLAKDVNHARAVAGGTNGYALSDTATAASAKHACENTDIKEMFGEIDQLLADECFDRALQLCDFLAESFEAVPKEVIKRNRERILAEAKLVLSKRVLEALANDNCDFMTAEKAVQIAYRLGLGASFCENLQGQIRKRCEQFLEARIYAVTKSGDYDEVLSSLENPPVVMPRHTIEQLTRLLVTARLQSDEKYKLQQSGEKYVGNDAKRQPVPSGKDSSLAPLTTVLASISKNTLGELTSQAWNVCYTAYEAYGKKDWVEVAKQIQALHALLGEAQPATDLATAFLTSASSEVHTRLSKKQKRDLAVAIKMLPESDHYTELQCSLLKQLSCKRHIFRSRIKNLVCRTGNNRDERRLI
jgi:hypothetical protein